MRKKNPDKFFKIHDEYIVFSDWGKSMWVGFYMDTCKNDGAMYILLKGKKAKAKNGTNFAIMKMSIDGKEMTKLDVVDERNFKELSGKELARVKALYEV